MDSRGDGKRVACTIYRTTSHRRGFHRVIGGISAEFGEMGHLHWNQVGIAWFALSEYFWRQQSSLVYTWIPFARIWMESTSRPSLGVCAAKRVELRRQRQR